jgi:hypothetical protein
MSQDTKIETNAQEDPFDAIREIQDNDPARAARRLAAYEASIKPERTPPSPGEVIGAVVGAGVLATVGVMATPEIYDSVNGIEYSAETFEHQVEQGESLQAIIDKYVEVDGPVNVTDIQNHVIADPANIDIFKDGGTDLHGGEILVLPVKVSD